MRPTGRAMLQVFSILAEITLTMQFSWLDQVINPGQLRTLGALVGENKDTSDWPRVTPAVSVKAHPSPFDLDIFESLFSIFF
jgi:hypothetical protein